MEEKKWNILGCLKIQKKWDFIQGGGGGGGNWRISRRASYRLFNNLAEDWGWMGGSLKACSSVFTAATAAVGFHDEHENYIAVIAAFFLRNDEGWREEWKIKNPWRRCVRFSMNFSQPNRWNLWKLTTGSFVWELRFCSLPSSLSLRYVRMPKSKKNE